MMNRKRSLRGDRNGGIEGLPLQLMIVILVATMGTAVILGWMGDIETPRGISEVSASPDCLDMTGQDDVYLTIYVYDQDKNPLEGATVLLTGLGVNMAGDPAYGETDADGRFTFLNPMFNFPGKNGFLNVTVSKSGYGEHTGTQILVIQG